MKIIRNGKIVRLAAGGGPGGGARLKAECQRLKTLYREETFNAKRSTSNFQGWRTKRWCLPRSGPDWRVPGVWTGGNLAKLKPIKVNQGEIFSEKEEAQEEAEGSRTDCGDEPSPPRRCWFPDRRCAKPAVGGVRGDGDLAKLNPIKVNQGDILKNKGTETEPAGFPRSWKNSRPQSVPLRAGQSLSRRDRLYQPWVEDGGWEARKRYPDSPALYRDAATDKLAEVRAGLAGARRSDGYEFGQTGGNQGKSG